MLDNLKELDAWNRVIKLFIQWGVNSSAKDTRNIIKHKNEGFCPFV